MLQCYSLDYTNQIFHFILSNTIVVTHGSEDESKSSSRLNLIALSD
ncbi:MAG: hypothetical protein ACI9YH_000563 [Colwellia sp.]|jgi:hypothetical protein